MIRLIYIILYLLLCISSSNSNNNDNRFEGQTVKYMFYGDKQVYVIYNSSKLPIWNPDTFNDLGLNWNNIIPLPQYVLNEFPLASKLDMYDSSNDYYIKNKSVHHN